MFEITVIPIERWALITFALFVLELISTELWFFFFFVAALIIIPLKYFGLADPYLEVGLFLALGLLGTYFFRAKLYPYVPQPEAEDSADVQ